MSIEEQLFCGVSMQLVPIDHEKDPELISSWTHDAGFMLMMYTDVFCPLSTWQIKKNLDELEKLMDEEKNRFYFHIKSLEETRLIGFTELMGISWTNGSGYIRIGIGLDKDRRHGYGTEVIEMLLRYAFTELNLYRLTALIPEYNYPADLFFQKFGFKKEVCRRQALERDYRYWNLHHYGLLAKDWKAR